jgi:secreted trypsin-like serine protease
MRWHAVVLAMVALVIADLHPTGVFAQEEIYHGRRIIGGEETDIKQHPWQVALTIKRPEGSYLCGGSIIAQQWVLTAAHCFPTPATPSAVTVKAGATNYVTEGVWSAIERIVVHEGYDPHTHANDIALIKLKAAPTGKVIPLATADTSLKPRQPLEVTGWGVTSEDGGTSHVLRKARVPYVANTTCNESASYNGRILSAMICAGEREGGIDACQGDSGGPLVWRSTEGPVLVGVVSHGNGCARKLKYGVYTRVSAYSAWINNVVAETPR